MPDENIIARFKAEVDEYKKGVNEAIGVTDKLDDTVTQTNKDAKKGFDESGKAAKNLGKEASGLERQMSQLGQRIIAAFAVERVIAFGQAALKSFREAELSANKLNFAVTNLAGGGIDLFKKLTKQAEEFQKISIFSDEQIQGAQTQLIQLGLTGDQVEALIPKILDLASAQGIDLAQATDKVIQGINGQTRGLKDAGIAFEDTGSKTENLAILSEKLAKFQGATAVALNTSAGAAKNLENRFDDLMETVGEFIDTELNRLKSTLVETADILSGNGGSITNAIKSFLAFETLGLSTKILGETPDEFRKRIKERFDELLVLESKGNAESRKNHLKASEERLEVLRGEFQKAEGAQKISLAIRIQEQEKFNEQLKKIGIQNEKIKDDLTIKGQSERNEKLKKLKEEELKIEKEAGEQRVKDIHAQLDANKEALDQQIKDIEDKNKDAQAEIDELLRINADNLTLTAQVLKEDKEKLLKDEKELNEKRIENAQMVSDAIFKAFEEGFEKRQDLLDKEIDLQEKAIETQTRLAEQGLTNTLAFEEKRAAELRRQQQVEAERQKRVKLLETFLNSLAEFSKADPKTAIQKALLQVALAQAATAVFAEEGGIIGEIGSKSNLSRRHKGGGDVLLHAQTGEGILSRREMDNLGRRNFHLLKDAARFPIKDNVFAMPQIAIAGGVQVSNADVVKELKTLQKVIKNKRESSYNLDEFGNYVKKQVENGVTTVTKGKLRKPRFK